MILARLPGISRWMEAAALVVLCPLLSPPYLVIALALLGLHVSLIPGRSPRYELAAAALSTVGLPFVAGSVWPASPVTALLAAPGLPWVEGCLRKAAAAVTGVGVPASQGSLLLRLPRGRRMTPCLAGLAGGVILQALVGLAVDRAVLAWTALSLIGFLAALIALSYIRIPSGFLTVTAPGVRVLAGDTVETEVALVSQSQLRVGIILEARHEWVRIVPARFALGTGRWPVRVRLTPPLAGPATVTAVAVAVDPWGLTAAQRDLNLVQLQIIPRAVYAAWLARRYLDQTRPGTSAAVTMSEAGLAAARRGLDYYGARLYEPGDGLRDVLWKHTLRLNQLVVKERREAYGEAVILTVNLCARTPEAMDRLAYRLVISALTLAREGVPVAFAAYAPGEVVLTTPPLEPRPAVLQALRLVDRLHVAPPPVRRLEAPRMARLRRSIARLQESRTESAGRLVRLLTFEHQAVLRRALAHPAAGALGAVAARVHGPAAVLVISPALEDDALDAVLDRLRGRGFHRLPGFGTDGADSRGVPRPAGSACA